MGKDPKARFTFIRNGRSTRNWIFNGKKYEVGRFKGLGEMNPETLKETTMNPKTRTLMRVQVLDHKATGDVFERLMGKDPKARFTFIQERAEYAELDI